MLILFVRPCVNETPPETFTGLPLTLQVCHIDILYCAKLGS